MKLGVEIGLLRLLPCCEEESNKELCRAMFVGGLGSGDLRLLKGVCWVLVKMVGWFKEGHEASKKTTFRLDGKVRIEWCTANDRQSSAFMHECARACDRNTHPMLNKKISS